MLCFHYITWTQNDSEPLRPHFTRLHNPEWPFQWCQTSGGITGQTQLNALTPIQPINRQCIKYDGWTQFLHGRQRLLQYEPWVNSVIYTRAGRDTIMAGVSFSCCFIALGEEGQTIFSCNLFFLFLRLDGFVRCIYMHFMILWCLFNCHHVNMLCLILFGSNLTIKWYLLLHLVLWRPKRTCTFDSLGHESPHEVGTVFTPVWPPKRMNLEHRTQRVSVIYTHSLVK